MSIDTYEQMSTGVFDITSIALVTLEMIYNTANIVSREDAVKRFQCEAPDYCPASDKKKSFYHILIFRF